MNEEIEGMKEEQYEEVPRYLQNNDLWIYQLDNTDVIKELSHCLKGEVWNAKENKWERQGKKLMNDEGIRMMVTIVASHLSKEKILTDISEDHVIRMTREIDLDLIDHLRVKWKGYEIDRADMSIIVSIIDHYIFCNLSRGITGRTIDALSPTMRRVESPRQEQEGNKFGWVPFFGGKK